MTRIYPVPLDSDEPNPEPLRVGSLFAGYGGLDLAVQTVLPQSHLVWYCEHEPPTEKNPTPDQAAAAVMAHRWPGLATSHTSNPGRAPGTTPVSAGPQRQSPNPRPPKENPVVEQQRLTASDSNLVAHAVRELTLCGMLDGDSDYDGGIGPAVLDLIRVFASQGHSGGSAAVTAGLFVRLAAFEVLSPLTDDPNEWIDVDGEGLLQSRRQASAFSRDGGTTYTVNGQPHAIQHTHPA